MAEEKLALTKENYYSKEADACYMSYSQFKDFIACEAKALAKIEGRYAEEQSKALKAGGYIDAYFSGELDEFIASNQDMFSSRGENKGQLKAEYQILTDIIDAVKSDQTFHDMFFSGEPQRIFTGEIAGVPFKGKIDMLYQDKIVDMKCMKDTDDVWSDTLKKRIPFYEHYGYHIQAAIYQELVRQATGIRLPYYLAVVTKTNPIQKHAYQFSQDVLDLALKLVMELAPRFDRIKRHEIEPSECGNCGYYHQNHKFNIFDIKEITLEDIQ